MLFNRPTRSFQRAQAKVRLLTLRMQLHLHCERDQPKADIRRLITILRSQPALRSFAAGAK